MTYPILTWNRIYLLRESCRIHWWSVIALEEMRERVWLAIINIIYSTLNSIIYENLQIDSVFKLWVFYKYLMTGKKTQTHAKRKKIDNTKWKKKNILNRSCSSTDRKRSRNEIENKRKRHRELIHLHNSSFCTTWTTEQTKRKRKSTKRQATS